jgi:molybdate transport system substrate-binding protein
MEEHVRSLPRSRRHRRLAAVRTAAAALALAACGGSSGPASPAAAGAAAPSGTATGSAAPSATATGRITVLAAASLTGVLPELGHRFEQAHPGTAVSFSFGPTSALGAQIRQGAPADVFASASEQDMDELDVAGLAVHPEPFAANVAQIAVPRGNPAKIDAVADLARPGVRVAVCQPAVPCGTLAAAVFAKAGVTVRPVTEEADVKATLTKVQLGEVDAGLVYVTDVLAARGKVDGVAVPVQLNASTRYPVAVVKGTRNAPLARAFVQFVLSAEGHSVLSAAGFAAP